jgi:hypothetical protein
MKPLRGIRPGRVVPSPEISERCFAIDQDIGRQVEEALERQPLGGQVVEPQTLLRLGFRCR